MEYLIFSIENVSFFLIENTRVRIRKGRIELTIPRSRSKLNFFSPQRYKTNLKINK